MTTNDATRANEKALPETNRRRFLLNAAVAGVGVAVTTSVAKTEEQPSDVSAIEENPGLVAAWKEFRDAEAEYYAATDDLGWLADEWKHLWPLAPEEILGAANATDYGLYADQAERDIIGRPMMRDTSVLTKRLSKCFRQKGGRTCFYIDQPDELTERLKEVRGLKPKGRSAKALEQNRKWQDGIIASLETRLRLAKEYEAETQRIRDVAGVEAAKQRIKRADDRLDAAATAVSRAPARTLLGLRLKADALVGLIDRWKLPHEGFVFGAAWGLADDLLGATQHLNGKKMATPLPFSEGGTS